METEVLELDAMSTKQEKTNNNDSLNKELIEREEIENSPFTIIMILDQINGEQEKK